MRVRQARAGSASLGAFGAGLDQGGQVDQVVVLRGALVEPGQPEHVVDQPAHPLRFQRDAAHGLVDLATAGEGTLLVELGVGAQRRQRGAQLVAGVGEEPAGGLLAGLALGDEVLDAGQHPVQRGPEPADLGPGVGGADPLGEIPGRDLVGLTRHGLDGPQAAAHDPGHATGGEQPRGRRADEEDQLELPDGLVDVAERGGGVDDAVAGEGLGQQPQLVLPVAAGHGLALMILGQRPQVGGQLRDEVRAAADKYPRPVGERGSDVVLAEDGPQRQNRPDDHLMGHRLLDQPMLLGRSGLGERARRYGRHGAGGAAEQGKVLAGQRLHPVQAEDALELLIGAAEQVAAQRGDRRHVKGHQREQGDGQHPGQHPGAQHGAARPPEPHRGPPAGPSSRGSRRL